MGLGEGEGMTSILPFLFELYYQEMEQVNICPPWLCDIRQVA